MKYEVIRDIKKFRDVHNISEAIFSEANCSAIEIDTQQQPKGTSDLLQRMTAPDDCLIVWEIERPRLNGLPSLSNLQRSYIQNKEGEHTEKDQEMNLEKYLFGNEGVVHKESGTKYEETYCLNKERRTHSCIFLQGIRQYQIFESCFQ